MISPSGNLRFPTAPSHLGSFRRRTAQRCLLGGTSVLSHLGSRTRNAFGILTYHRISDSVAHDPAMLNVTPARLRKQLAGLLRLGYQPYRLSTLVQRHAENKPIPHGAFAVVFDDGYEDLFIHARPVLRELKVPATVFLATAYLDSFDPFPFADWPGSESSRPLSIGQCHRLVSDGFVELGSHTHTHQDFRNRPQQLRLDLQESVQTLWQRFGVASPTLSLPYGFTSPELVDAARESGVSCALTAECQLVTSQIDPFHWGRFGATEFDTARSLKAKLDGWYTGCRTAWRRLRYGHVAASQPSVEPAPPAKASSPC